MVEVTDLGGDMVAALEIIGRQGVGFGPDPDGLERVAAESGFLSKASGPLFSVFRALLGECRWRWPRHFRRRGVD